MISEASGYMETKVNTFTYQALTVLMQIKYKPRICRLLPLKCECYTCFILHCLPNPRVWLEVLSKSTPKVTSEKVERQSQYSPSLHYVFPSTFSHCIVYCFNLGILSTQR